MSQSEDPVQRLLARLDSSSLRILIGMAGLPGSGKSTLAARLAAEVNAIAGPDTLATLGMDGFHLTRDALMRMPNPDEVLARRGVPWTFDVPALASRLQLLRDAAGREAVEWPGFDHGGGDPVENAIQVRPETRLVLVEGLYLLHQGGGWDTVSRCFDERWYLDTPLEVSLSRLVNRHIAAWGLTQDAAEQRVAANDRLNAEIVAQSRAFADWRFGASY